jgi:tetratricopeptide (TPR) repeat protein
LGPPVAYGQSSLLADFRRFYPRYHENPARLDELRAGFEQVLKREPMVDNFLALAQLCFTWGDVRARNRAEKESGYRCGREAAQKAIELAPRSIPAHFWYATNTARLGQAQWGFQAFFYVPTIRKEIEFIFDHDPGYAPAYALAGNVDYELPGFLGGDLDKAEAMFRKGLELDPKFTTLRLGLGKTLIKKGRLTEARQELQAVLNDKEPRYQADWVMKDSKEARELLESIQGK